MACGVQHLVVSHAAIGDGGAQAIGDALANNETLESLSLPENGIQAVGAQRLAWGMERNIHLRMLDVQHNAIGPEGMMHFGEALSGNDSLKALNVGYNHLDVFAGAHIANILRYSAVDSIELCWNKLGDHGTAQIAEALGENCSLLYLGLSSNSIEVAGSAALAQALRGVQFLEVLDLSKNRVGNKGAG
eukprot:TRINITY_DN2630_c0_g1_i1.p1 TRINITY_DN2630_c0_g1~~TRINITY_DN2630_c0_g1_i1.p1  ORF type:complete len:189 (-),score=54.85 TRINITY_DN2630_c0_g1_i1:459-1025(-)